MNPENNWRYEWTALSPYYTWTIVETDVPVGYIVKTEQQGVTCTITNTAEPVEADPPVKKYALGDTPAVKGIFRFKMEAVSNTAGFAIKDMPMPPGSIDGVKIMDIEGAQEFGFGVVRYLKEGVYVYRISEIDMGDKDYTYDRTVYTLTRVIGKKDGKLTVEDTVEMDSSTVEQMQFENTYTDPGPNADPDKPTPPPGPTPEDPKPTLPQTGQLWWPVPFLLILGMLLLGAGIVRWTGKTKRNRP